MLFGRLRDLQQRLRSPNLLSGFVLRGRRPTFTASTPACGHQVAATVTLQIAAVLTNVSVPLTASACFP